jgi:hypothetical protein
MLIIIIVDYYFCWSEVIGGAIPFVHSFIYADWCRKHSVDTKARVQKTKTSRIEQVTHSGLVVQCRKHGQIE